MPEIIISRPTDRAGLLRQMNLDAAYDIADDNRVASEELPSVGHAMDICAPKGPPKVPKLFVSGNCIFNCAYCGCRASYDRKHYCNQPNEMADIAIAEANRSGRGVFISSAIYRSADYTEELIAETCRIMRQQRHYTGYIHAKVMPGADPELIRRVGMYANRLSVNIEVARSAGYDIIAKQKNKANILTPMRQISDFIADARGSITPFARSQTTQLMAGSTNEDDRTIVTLARALYKKYRLKRVYYTPFQYWHNAKGYENLQEVRTPHWRMARLYQADRLMELYKFSPDEIAPADAPFLDCDIDPKAAWALRNLHLFPIEVNTADYEMLLRIPGIGLTYAQRILEARRHTSLTREILEALGVPLKKSGYFITCRGKFEGTELDRLQLREKLATPLPREPQRRRGDKQMSMDEITIGF